MAGESPDRSKQRESSAEPTSGNGGPVPGKRDPRLAVSREAVYYRDPHICLRCRYRSNELLWQCPHCHEWNTFVEERLAAAHDGERAEG